MTDTSSEFTNPKFHTRLRADGIVQQVWEPGAGIGIDDAIESVAAVRTFAGGWRRPLLVDTRATGPVDRPARMEYASSGEFVSAIALIVKTPLSRMSGNFLIAVSRPMPPTRLFDDEASARAWLLDFTPVTTL